MKKIHVTTLGCSKNVVDSEVLMGQLAYNRFELIERPQEADVLIINTCGFIQDAKEESLQAIFEALKLKEEDPAKKVFVAGCLSQRYRQDIEKEIPEVDAIFGTEDYASILNSLGKKHAALDNLYRLRKVSTPRHYAYLKISEGCNHNCAFCAIPAIRGKHRSRSMESLIDEAQKLAENGAKELILISQDTSYYGRDIYGRSAITELTRRLADIPGLRWIRLLYWYPTNFPLDILDLMKNHPKVLPYIDIPIQHISDAMLHRMRRGDTRKSLLDLLRRFREEIPEVALRTTLILGHPGETEEDFQELYDFVKDIKFDRLGTFVYSDEENTAAYALPGKVEPRVALERQEKIMELQQNISITKNKQFINRKIEVIIDEFQADSGTCIGRTYRDAPEIDNEVIISDLGNGKRIANGSLLEVKIEEASEYELYGKIV